MASTMITVELLNGAKKEVEADLIILLHKSELVSKLAGKGRVLVVMVPPGMTKEYTEEEFWAKDTPKLWRQWAKYKEDYCLPPA